jgi:toluene monooxygenase system protein B
MATIPLTAAHREDFVILLVLVDTEDSMEEVAAKVAAHTVGIRVPAKPAPLQVFWQGKPLPPTAKVAEVGIQPMDFVEVAYAE